MIKSKDSSAAKNKGLTKLKEKVDTTIAMFALADSAREMTADHKRLIKHAKMHMLINEEKKEMKLTLNYPFANLEDMKKLVEMSSSKGGGLGMLGKGLGGGNEEEASKDWSGEIAEAGLPDFASYFDLTFKNGLLERKFNEVKFKASGAAEKLGSMGEGAEMMGTMTMNTVLHLPRPAKKAEGPSVKLSADEKTVTITNSIADVIANPKVLAYRVEY